jgi:putative transposase
MTRRRTLYPNAVVHVVQRGHNRAAVFVDDIDCTYYLRCVRDAAIRSDSSVHAYVLMTNHVHLLVTAYQEESLPRMMAMLGTNYVRYFNARHARTGTLWEARYRAALVESDRYFFACMRYIEMNPVRAGLASEPRDYRWSSFRANGMGVTDPVIVEHSAYEGLGTTSSQRHAAYLRLFGDSRNEDDEAIRTATRRQCSIASLAPG